MNITIIGMGVANEDYIFPVTKKAIETADVIIGAKRLTDNLINSNVKIYNIINPKEIADIILKNNFANNVILMSGDVGFYSGTKGLLPYLEGLDVNIIPGISSVQFFSAKIKNPWQNWNLTSAHGIDCNIYSIVNRNKNSFFLTGGKWTVNEICRFLTGCDLGNLNIHIGENLGAKDEKISKGKVNEFTITKISNLAVCLIENENPCKRTAFSINDDDFIRGKIPMTKQEVRSLVIAKLALNDDDIVYDIGAGTGSVSVEAALSTYNGHVYAIEREWEGCELIKENAKKHKAYNLTCIEGCAPKVLIDLPTPNVAFIGGSGGNMKEIMQLLLDKNPQIRFVITAVTLETLCEATEIFKILPIKEDEIVNISVSKSKKLGNYHMMLAQNPIYIISGRGII